MAGPMGLFSRGDKKPGFMAGVRDEVHGAHQEGSEIVLWSELGGVRFQVVTATAETVAAPQGSFRILYQPSKTIGVPTGDLLVTAEEVDRDLALRICSRRGISGLMGVYTPSRSDADALMRAAIGEAPTEFSSCHRFMRACVSNLRGRPGESGLPGPMCCYGEFRLPGDGSADAAARTQDEDDGFHVVDGMVRLSPDLGGEDLEFRPLDPDSVNAAEAGRFYAVLTGECKSVPGTPALSGPIGRDAALAIASSWYRSGVLGLYTPDRADAEALAREASTQEPKERFRKRRGVPLACFEPVPYDHDPTAAVYFGKLL